MFCAENRFSKLHHEKSKKKGKQSDGEDEKMEIENHVDEEELLHKKVHLNMNLGRRREHFFSLWVTQMLFFAAGVGMEMFG